MLCSRESIRFHKFRFAFVTHLADPPSKQCCGVEISRPMHERVGAQKRHYCLEEGEIALETN